MSDLRAEPAVSIPLPPSPRGAVRPLRSDGSTVLRRAGVLLSICLLAGVAALSSAQTGEPPPDEIHQADLHHSVWRFSGSRVHCALSHEIPPFGEARFQQLTGDELSFRIETLQPVPKRIDGVLREASPPWRHDEADPREQPITVEAGRQPIRLEHAPAAWLLSALAGGRIGSFEMRDWNDGRKQRLIRLSPVNFQQPYREFKQCLQDLDKAGFEGLRHSTVHFAPDRDRLDERAQATLRTLADYIKADSRILAVRIAGHADEQGKSRHNLRLSARRAQRVYDYLLAQGVEPKLLAKNHYGESRPRLRGRSEKARAANRRAEIELVR